MTLDRRLVALICALAIIFALTVVESLLLWRLS
jgi:hypothetical protein